jgi:hypothetical protein
MPHESWQRGYVDAVVHGFIDQYDARHSLTALVDCLHHTDMLGLMIEVYLTQPEAVGNHDFMVDMVQGFLATARDYSRQSAESVSDNGLNADGVIQAIIEQPTQFILILTLYDTTSAAVLSWLTRYGVPLDYGPRIELLEMLVADE